MKTANYFSDDSGMQMFNPEFLLAAAVFVILQPAQAPAPLVKENATVKISEHAYVIPDGNVGAVPNVGIVAGNRAVLVIDTGLGPRNGQTVLREVRKISKDGEIYIVATHFHSEHALGESAFPADAKVIRARAQQQDIDEFGVQPNFAARSPVMAELMKDAQFRRADEIFESEKILDLGGVRVRLLALGGTHTNGDTMAFVEGDNVLFAGDVVMNRRFLGFGSPRSSLQAWLNSLDRVAALRPTRIVPSHGESGDGSLIETNRAYLKAVETRVGELKREGKTVEQATEAVVAEFKAKYPNWSGNAASAARSAYAEAK